MSDVSPPPPPPPPPPGEPPNYGTPPAGAGGGDLEAGAAISYGWNALKRYLGPFVLIALVIFVVQAAFSAVGLAFDNYWLRMTWNIVTWVVGLILAMGLIRAALAVLDGREPEVGMLFKTDRLGAYVIASILVGILGGIGLILCIIPGLIVFFLFALYGYAIVDGRTNDAIDAMKMSYQLVTKHVGALLLLFILCFLINILGVLLCFIGLLFTYPITAVAIAYAWRKISGGQVAQIA